MKNWLRNKLKGVVITLAAVVIALQIIIPTVFDVLTSAVLVVIVWWSAKLDRRK